VKILLICAFSLKFPIDIPKIELLVAFTDRIGSGDEQPSKDMVAKTRHLMQRSSKSVPCLRVYRDFSVFARWRLSAILVYGGAELDH